MIFKPFRYLFYRIYSWNLEKWGRVSAPDVAAVGAIAVLFFVNLLTIITIVAIFTGFNLFDELKFSKIQLIISLIILYGIFDIYLYRGCKCADIIKQFKKEDKAFRRKGTIFVWCYVVGTILIFIFFSFLEGQV